MAKTCYMCGKTRVFGNSRSHSNKSTNRQWKVNGRFAKLDIDGTKKTVFMCTRCWRSMNKAIKNSCTNASVS